MKDQDVKGLKAAPGENLAGYLLSRIWTLHGRPPLDIDSSSTVDDEYACREEMFECLKEINARKINAEDKNLGFIVKAFQEAGLTLDQVLDPASYPADKEITQVYSGEVHSHWTSGSFLCGLDEKTTEALFNEAHTFNQFMNDWKFKGEFSDYRLTL